jgi:hypothetical protein
MFWCQVVSFDERSLYYVFFTLKVHEKKRSKIGLIFGFGLILILGISFWFFEVINKFITISKVFWVKNI